MPPKKTTTNGRRKTNPLAPMVGRPCRRPLARPRAELRSSAKTSARQAEAALGDQAALDLVGADADDPHQRMAQPLLVAAAAQRTGRPLRQRGARAEDVERGLTEAFHQLAREDLADRAHLGRRRPAR